MEPGTLASGKAKIGMVRASRYGKTVQGIRAIGAITRPMVRARFGMFMAINTRVAGLMIKPTVTELTRMLMEQNTKAIGRMICSMAMVSKSGQMAPSTRAIM